MKKLFGTDGVRGVANLEPMTSETAMKLGRAVAHVFKRREGRHQIVIGKDTRLSGYMLESALVSGICSLGVDVQLVGPLPTPAIAFLTRSLRADAGVMISASHNPYQDNGIKFFSNDGFKLPDEMELRIEELILSNEIEHIRPTAGEIGKAFRIDDAEGRYIEFVKRSLPRDMDFQGLRVVLDCANGAGYHVFPKVVQELGAKVWVICAHPDGININHECGAVHPEQLQEAVRTHQADIGIALDGDADRCVFVCEGGHVVNGDHALAAFALDLKERGRLKHNTVVGTVMSNFGFELAMTQSGIKVERTPVGDRYILERMVKEDFSLGGEQSGHMIFLNYHSSGDGMISGLQMLKLMKRSGKPLSELTQCMTSFPQVLLGVKVPHKPALQSLPKLQHAISVNQERLNGTGRILVRYSGTEPLVRVMVEGQSDSIIQEIAEDLVSVVKSCIT
ncbi:MAG: phosphoglucosamine mutase [Nitrospirales bacterium]|nr:MAG: phosphoglucosamine mutase [Nitrospirales bacterium]